MNDHGLGRLTSGVRVSTSRSAVSNSTRTHLHGSPGQVRTTLVLCLREPCCAFSVRTRQETLHTLLASARPQDMMHVHMFAPKPLDQPTASTWHLNSSISMSWSPEALAKSWCASDGQAPCHQCRMGSCRCRLELRQTRMMRK